ncbi:MAG: phycocyanobilin:ferredoxin oxidoreductase [Leptolyngbyaceae cyanobacterium]
MNLLKPSLRQQQHVLIRQLADTIESIWGEHLTLAPYKIPADLGYIENQLEGETLIIENCCYQTPQFRKLHLELAQVGNGLDILHCVMFPCPDYALPIFGCDIVGLRGQISAAIVDLSPVCADRNLPATYQLALSKLDKYEFEHPRDLPEWGKIFSDFCTFVRPVNQLENQGFLDLVQNFLLIHCDISNKALPVQSVAERELILAAQTHYCDQQLQNDKTRRILERSFGDKWADRYMNTMLFDMNPT